MRYARRMEIAGELTKLNLSPSRIITKGRKKRMIQILRKSDSLFPKIMERIMMRTGSMYENDWPRSDSLMSSPV